MKCLFSSTEGGVVIGMLWIMFGLGYMLGINNQPISSYNLFIFIVLISVIVLPQIRSIKE